MKQLTEPQIKNWVQYGQQYLPSAVSAVCPGCQHQVLFSTIQHSFDAHRDTGSSTAICPGCSAKVHFWTIDPRTAKRILNGKVYMHPSPPNFHESVTFGPEVPDSLKRAYHSTVDAYNASNFVATAVGCRRTLEGVFKFLLPEPARAFNLAKTIEEVTKSIDLGKPLKSLSHSIRQGGNLAAHFDMEKEPTREMAQSMVELLEYIIDYLYVLPRQIEDLDSRL